MAWREMSPMDQRMQFVTEHATGLFTMTELAEQYGVKGITPGSCRAVQAFMTCRDAKSRKRYESMAISLPVPRECAPQHAPVGAINVLWTLGGAAP
jgi:hypothetical protein